MFRILLIAMAASVLAVDVALAQQPTTLAQAEAAYRRELRQRPTDVDALEPLVRLLGRQSRHREAYELVGDAIKIEPGNAELYNLRGVVSLVASDPEAAVADLDTAIRLNPRSTKAYANRAAAYRHLSRLDDAERDIGRAIELDPNQPRVLNNRATLRLSKGDAQGALEDLDRAIALADDQPHMYLNRGEALLLLDRPREAMEAAHRAMAVMTGHDVGPALELRCLAAVRTSALETAEFTIKVMIDLGKPSSSKLCASVVAEARGDGAAAERYWNEAVAAARRGAAEKVRLERLRAASLPRK